MNAVTMNTNGALSYIDRLKNTRQRDYALRLFRYYRDYGTQNPSPWPHQQAAASEYIAKARKPGKW